MATSGTIHSEQVILSPHKVGMLVFLSTEVAFFGTLIMTYIYFLNQSTRDTPNPAQVFPWSELWITGIFSICLFSSSATIHMAEKNLRRGRQQGFLSWFGLTILLGIAFLIGTGLEWSKLIGKHHLTISTNMFGTTYYTLVGFHAFHVSMGVLAMTIVYCLALRRELPGWNETGVTVVSWYWHFVDAVWVVVFSLVYLIGR